MSSTAMEHHDAFSHLPKPESTQIVDQTVVRLECRCLTCIQKITHSFEVECVDGYSSIEAIEARRIRQRHLFIDAP